MRHSTNTSQQELVFRDNVSDALRRHRKDNGTLRELSEKTGLSISYLSDIEHGRSTPSMYNFVLIFKNLNGRPHRVLEHIILKSGGMDET